MKLEYLIPFWGALVISNVHAVANSNIGAHLWIGFALVILFMDYKDRKKK